MIIGGVCFKKCLLFILVLVLIFVPLKADASKKDIDIVLVSQNFGFDIFSYEERLDVFDSAYVIEILEKSNHLELEDSFIPYTKYKARVIFTIKGEVSY